MAEIWGLAQAPLIRAAHMKIEDGALTIKPEMRVGHWNTHDLAEPFRSDSVLMFSDTALQMQPL